MLLFLQELLHLFLMGTTVCQSPLVSPRKTHLIWRPVSLVRSPTNHTKVCPHSDNNMNYMPRTNMMSGSASLNWIVSACFSLSSFTSAGKLKPFGAQQENTSLNKSVHTDSSVTVPSHQKNYKQHQVQTRWDAYFSCAIDWSLVFNRVFFFSLGILLFRKNEINWSKWTD